MTLPDRIAFAASGLDRAAALRADPSALAAALANGAVLPVWRGRPALAGAQRDDLAWVPAGHPVLAAGRPAVFLGLDDGVPRFACDISAWEPPGLDPAGIGGFLDADEQVHPALPLAGLSDLRGAMLRLTARAAELAATARALCHWHAAHGHCAACGAASQPDQGGWQRRCPACGAVHFPRTDPVVIMRVTHGNRVLLGRSPGWPAGMYSLLAGFVEPGETVEAAVRREVAEETGIRVGAVRYLASQPWPFPASLMLGCAAEALEDEIRLDPAELEDALWITREEMLQVMTGRHPRLRAPRAGAIARALVANWVADRPDCGDTGPVTGMHA
ncbi:MAG: NAD(+) diphosphatase [Rhodobacterales bacterium]|nr:NAD(+) diphosphatase [Rhodobacterales bacterium]